MSKSLGNYIGISEPAAEMFGKLMSISDDLMWRYFELLSFRAPHEIEMLRKQTSEGLNPRDVKFDLAQELVGRFHSPTAAEREKQAFISRFSDRTLPSELAVIAIKAHADTLSIAQLLRSSGLVSSTSEAKRLIKQGAVRIDNERIEDENLEIAPGTIMTIQVGKRRIAKISLES